MRCAIYVRVSTDEQAKHGYSLAGQRYVCEKKAKELGATEIKVFQEEGTGATLDRPCLTELRDAIRNKQFDIVVVYDPDRFHRKLINQLIITEEIEKAGVRLEFVNFEWKNTPEGRLFYQIRGAISEYEREKIKERMIFGKTQKARQGKMPVGFDCYGYNYEPGSGKISINKDEAEIIKIIFDEFINKDRGINGIAKMLNNSCVPTRRRCGKWHRQVVRQILLKSDTYAGMWYYGRNKIPLELPPIIDKETAKRTREKLEQSRRLWAGKGFHKYLLSGIIECADCGNTMCGVWAKWWGKYMRKYTCRKSCQGYKHPGCNPGKYINADTIEQIVWKQVCEWLHNPDALANEVAKNLNTDRLEEEYDKVKKQINEIKKGRENILNVLASGLVNLDKKRKAQLAELNQKQQRLEARKKDLEKALFGAKTTAAKMAELRLLAKEVLQQLDKLEFKEKKSLVRALVRQVIVSGRNKNMQVTIYARIPENVNSSIIFC